MHRRLRRLVLRIALVDQCDAVDGWKGSVRRRRRRRQRRQQRRCLVLGPRRRPRRVGRGGGAPRRGEDDVSLGVVVVVVVVDVDGRLSSSRRVVVSDALLRGGDGGGCGNIARRRAPSRGDGRPRPVYYAFRGRGDYYFGALVRHRDGYRIVGQGEMFFDMFLLFFGAFPLA